MGPSGHPNSFVEDQISTWSALVGESVSEWRGTEMALRESVGGEPQFESIEAPFLQLLRLEVSLGGATREITTYQNDDNWGLFIPESSEMGQLPATEGIFRTRTLDELPRGRIDEVIIGLDTEGDLSEVRIALPGNRLTLIAGEVYEGRRDDPLQFVRPDESVLAFTDESAITAIDWTGDGRIVETIRLT